MIWKEGWKQNLEKSLAVIERLEKASYVTLIIDANGEVAILAYPNQDDAEKRELVNALTPLVGKLEKKNSGTDITLDGNKDGLSVHISAYDKCEIVGYVEEEVPETITTGNMKKVRIAVSDCELKAGKYKGKQLIVKDEVIV